MKCIHCQWAQCLQKSCWIAFPSFHVKKLSNVSINIGTRGLFSFDTQIIPQQNTAFYWISHKRTGPFQQTLFILFHFTCRVPPLIASCLWQQGRMWFCPWLWNLLVTQNSLDWTIFVQMTGLSDPQHQRWNRIISIIFSSLTLPSHKWKIFNILGSLWR